MASILDAIKEVLSSPDALASAVVSKAVGATPVGAFTDAATESANALRTVAQKITSGELEAKLDRALTTAETWVALTSGAQLLAAVAAIGIFVVQKKAYDHMTTRRSRARNPRKHRRRSR